MSGQAAWASIEDAIHDEVATALGLAGGLVVWEYQSGDRPLKSTGAPVFATLKLDNIAGDWHPDAITTVIPMASAPVDLSLDQSAHTEFEVTVQIFSTYATGINSARSKAEKVSKFFDRESTVIRLEDAGISVLDRATVQAIPAILETKYESRALLVMRLAVRSGDEEITTYIETVDSTVTFT